MSPDEPLAPAAALVERAEPTLRNALVDCLDVIEPLRDELRKQGRDDAATCCDEVMAYSRSALALAATARSQRLEDLQRIRDEQEQISNRCLSGCDPRYAPAIAMLAAIDEVFELLTPPAVADRASAPAPLEQLAERWRADAEAKIAVFKTYCFGGERDGEMLDEDIERGVAECNVRKRCANELEAALRAVPSRREP